MRMHLGRLVAVVAATAGVLVGVHTVAEAGSAEWVPPDNTIVRVTGNAADGFGIHYYDGSALYPPTDSEALAGCSEYQRWGDRLRCRVKVRVWYRDLKQTKRAIRHAKQL